MKSKAICLALLAFAFGAQARPVSQSQAEQAAGVWARSGAVLGARLGQSVASSQAVAVTDDVSFYALSFADGGTVFMAADTADSPVIAFTTAAEVDLTEGSAVRELLSRDVMARRRLRETRSALTSSSASGSKAESPEESIWSALLSGVPSAGTSALSATASAVKPVSSVSDIRVSPLLKSKWNQTTGGGGYCWNYYTPEHIACGCTATAAGQIMRYFTWPTASLPSASYACKLNGKSVSYTTRGGTFAWELMKDKLSSCESEETREAIGHLVYDIGVTLGTEYSTEDGGSAIPERLGRLYHTFKYANAFFFWDGTSYYTGKGGLHELALRKKVIYANLDAGRPVQLSIYGYPKNHMNDDGYWAGHSVVGDGYGFYSVNGVETAFVHINMGWGGTDDLWYNIPEINAAESGAHAGDSGYDFLYMGGAAFNISAETSGLDILSGRVINDEGEPVAGVSVAAVQAGSVVKTVQTNSRGIYALELEGNQTYAIEAVSADGKQVETIDAVLLPKTVGNADWVVSSKSSVGNSWGNDLVLVDPKARTIVGNVTNIHSRLDHALTLARQAAVAQPGTSVTVELLADCAMDQSAAIDFDCVLRSAEGTLLTVMRGGDARFKVSEGGRLTLERVTFAASGTVLAEVAAGGNLRLGDDVTLGLSSEDVAIRTETAAGFTLAGALLTGFTIDCAGARGVGAPFGSVVGLTDSAASDSAAMIANAADAFGEIRGVAQGGSLQWAEIDVPLKEAVGYYVGADGKTTNTAARLDRLFPKFMDALSDGTVGSDRVLMIAKSGCLTCRVTSGLDFTVRGAAGVVISNGLAETMSEAGFIVTNGTMTIRDLTFDGFSGAQFLVVNGEGASCVLGSGAKLRNIERTGNADKSNQGPIAVKRGLLRIEGAEISNCRAKATNGGGVCLAGANCRLEMYGGIVTNCTAGGLGGGVYAGIQATVKLSGGARIVGNTSSQGVDNLYLGSGVRAEVMGVLSDGEIGIRSAIASVNREGGVFATGAEQVLESSAGCFRNDGHPELIAVAGSGELSWGTAPVVPAHRPLDPSQSGEAAARIVFADRTELWETAQWALESLTNYTGVARVELLKDGYFDADLPLAGTVTLRSAGGVHTLSRAPGGRLAVTKGAKLTLADVILRGINAEGDKPSRLPLVKSNGGEVELASGAVIEDVRGTGARDAGAVAVWSNGVFRMSGGAVIRRCVNDYVNQAEGTGVGAGLLVDDGLAYLYGGTITGCRAYKAGGVFIGNEADVHVANEMGITNNTAISGVGPNLLVSDLSTLYLDGKMTGRIGYTEGVRKAYDVFGEANAEAFAGSEEDLATSARRFVHDRTQDIGAAVRGAKRTLLVWSGAVSSSGVYVDSESEELQIVRGGEPIAVSKPHVETGLVYDGTEQCGVAEGVGYETSGHLMTKAGTYHATVTLRVGFVWDDGSAGPLDLEWTIAKATYDMSRVQFEDKTCVYDGTVKFIDILPGQLPEGVSVSYENNNQTEAGEYVITAKFTGDADNYEPIDDMTATLTITEMPVPPPPPPPPPPVETNYPTPIAFKSIESLGAGQWKLVVTNGVKDCWYSLFGGTVLDETTFTQKAKFQLDADGVVIFTVDTGTDAQWFWRAKAEPGEVRGEN